MASTTFDWRSLAASDEEIQRQGQPGALYAGQDPASWKSGLVAAYFKEDYLQRGAKKRGIGLVDIAAAPVGLAWNLLFGFPKSKRVDYTIGPEEAALVVRDGKVLGIYNQDRLRTGGTFMDWLRGRAGEQPNYRLLLADCSPFDVEIPFTRDLNPLLSREGDVIEGRAKVRLKVDPAHLENLLGLLRGRSLLHVADFAEQIRDKIFARVIVPQVREHPAAQVRANVGLQDELRAECRREVEAAYREVGIILDDLDVLWELTDDERFGIEQRHLAREEQAKEDEAARLKAAAEREMGLEGTKRELADNLVHQTELRRTLQARERELAEATSELERTKAQIEVQRAQLQLESMVAEHRRLQDRLDREQNMDLEERETLAALRLKERKRTLEREDELERSRSVQGHELDLLERYKDMTPDQLLAIKSAQSPEAAEALAEKFRADAASGGEATKRVLDLADRHAEHSQRMAEDFGRQMGGVAEHAATVKSGRPVANCPKCGESIQPNWKVCPYCSSKLKA